MGTGRMTSVAMVGVGAIGGATAAADRGLD